MATYGSIYISPKELVSKINIKNYMHIGDVALKQNKRNITEPTIPVFNEHSKYIEREQKICSSLGPDESIKWSSKSWSWNCVGIQYMIDEPQNIIWICYYITLESFNPIYKPYYTTRIRLYNSSAPRGVLIGNKQEWEIHNSYFNVLNELLFKNNTNNINDLPQNPDRISPTSASSASDNSKGKLRTSKKKLKGDAVTETLVRAKDELV